MVAALPDCPFPSARKPSRRPPARLMALALATRAAIEKQLPIYSSEGEHLAFGLARLKGDITAAPRGRGPPSQSRPDLPHGGSASVGASRAKGPPQIRRQTDA